MDGLGSTRLSRVSRVALSGRSQLKRRADYAVYGAVLDSELGALAALGRRVETGSGDVFEGRQPPTIAAAQERDLARAQRAFAVVQNLDREGLGGGAHPRSSVASTSHESHV